MCTDYKSLTIAILRVHSIYLSATLKIYDKIVNRKKNGEKKNNWSRELIIVATTIYPPLTLDSHATVATKLQHNETRNHTSKVKIFGLLFHNFFSFFNLCT